MDNVLFTLHPWIGLIYTKTNAKEEQICPSVSIQERALNLKLVLWHPKWKKGRKYSLFAHMEIADCHWKTI